MAPLLFYSVQRQTILLVKGEPLGGKGLINRNYLNSTLKRGVFFAESERDIIAIEFKELVLK